MAVSGEPRGSLAHFLRVAAAPLIPELAYRYTIIVTIVSNFEFCRNIHRECTVPCKIGDCRDRGSTMNTLGTTRRSRPDATSGGGGFGGGATSRPMGAGTLIRGGVGGGFGATSRPTAGGPSATTRPSGGANVSSATRPKVRSS
eukprot:886725-Prorocentrum_minimum.AAC.3